MFAFYVEHSVGGCLSGAPSSSRPDRHWVIGDRKNSKIPFVRASSFLEDLFAFLSRGTPLALRWWSKKYFIWEIRAGVVFKWFYRKHVFGDIARFNSIVWVIPCRSGWFWELSGRFSIRKLRSGMLRVWQNSQKGSERLQETFKDFLSMSFQKSCLKLHCSRLIQGHETILRNFWMTVKWPWD